jgi:two-component system cell cycle sensor histidine kinase/response regulator CckA
LSAVRRPAGDAGRRQEGTRFNIYLKVAERPLADKKENLQETAQFKETILLVDDEDVITEVSRDILEIMGYNVLVAHNGREAVDIYSGKKDEIDLIVQDMIMPGMSGEDTFFALKKINPAVKVILSSGYMINKQIEDIMGQGCCAFIQKPFRMEDFSELIRKVLDNS